MCIRETAVHKLRFEDLEQPEIRACTVFNVSVLQSIARLNVEVGQARVIKKLTCNIFINKLSERNQRMIWKPNMINQGAPLLDCKRCAENTPIGPITKHSKMGSASVE